MDEGTSQLDYWELTDILSGLFLLLLDLGPKMGRVLVFKLNRAWRFIPGAGEGIDSCAAASGPESGSLI